jgi:peptidoglycan/LPS O-acetylase OafA/YrhL
MFGIILKPLNAVIHTSPQTAARSQAIDFLRGVAILLVLGCHFVVAPTAAGVLAPLAELWYRIGWAGVDLFFVLSGYLVSGLLFAEFKRNGRIDAGRFLVRRGLKIWPAYFAYLAFVAGWIAWHRAAPGPSLWPNWLHVQNYLGTPRVHTWSLAVEEHFYLGGAALAALFLVRSRFGFVQRVFPPLAIASLAGVAAIRYAEFADGGRAALNLFATHLRFDGLLIGSLVAYVAHFEPARLQWTRRYPRPCVLAGLLLATPVLFLTPDHSARVAGPGLTVMYGGFALAMLGVIGLEQGGERDRWFISLGPVRWIARMGFFSYGIYLWHLDLARVPMAKLGAMMSAVHLPDTVVWFSVTSTYIALAVGAGAMMSRAIEIPCLALRDRFFPSRTARTKTLPSAVPAGIPAAAAPATPPVIAAMPAN